MMKKTTILVLFLAAHITVCAGVAKDSEGMYQSSVGNGPSVAEAVQNTTGGTVYTGREGNANSAVSKDGEALYQHNSGRYTKTVTADFVPKPAPIVKTTWKTVYRDRIIYRYKNCASGGASGGTSGGAGGTVASALKPFSVRWRIDSGKYTSNAKTYNRRGFTLRVYDEPYFRIFRSPSGQGLGFKAGATGGIGFSDGSYLQWGSVWRGGSGGNKRSWYFLYARN